MTFPPTMVHRRKLRLGVACVAALGLLVALPASAQGASAPVPLGAADSFVVLAHTTITNTGASMLDGDIGLTPGSSITGMPPLVLHGASHVGDTVAGDAQKALGAAFDNVAARKPATPIPNELGGSSLTPGVYSSGVFTIDKTLTLNANHDPNAIFVFQSAATLEAGAGSHVRLINGASPCNVFWLVRSSATLQTTADFSGNILALTDIHLRTGARVQGRALAETGAVTLDSNTISNSSCRPAPVSSAVPSAQVVSVPKGAVRTGDGSTSGGSTSGGSDTAALLVGALLLAAGGATLLAARRRRVSP
jgi:Ice-binding-like